MQKGRKLQQDIPVAAFCLSFVVETSTDLFAVVLVRNS